MQQGAGHKPYRARLRIDGAFSLELQYCNEHGIPHSQFLDWEPADRAKALAYLLEQAERCQMCGTAGWEWNANRRAYEPVETFCPGCQMKAGKAAADPPRHGVTVELAPTGTPESRQRRERERAAYRESRQRAKRR